MKPLFVQFKEDWPRSRWRLKFLNRCNYFHYKFETNDSPFHPEFDSPYYEVKANDYETPYFFPRYRQFPKSLEDACSLEFWMKNYVASQPFFRPLIYEGPEYFSDWGSLYFSPFHEKLFRYDIYQRTVRDLVPYTADYLKSARGFLHNTDDFFESDCGLFGTDVQYDTLNGQLKVK